MRGQKNSLWWFEISNQELWIEKRKGKSWIGKKCGLIIAQWTDFVINQSFVERWSKMYQIEWKWSIWTESWIRLWRATKEEQSASKDDKESSSD